ncbi:MAG: hypothetical protein WC729_01185 [Sphingomonas sp.]|jgi:hypothetical protein|uniref:hypothetical protein n=1 Tax=Sphingomonas sp. TaxID=28214 RepID=UPI003562589F
MVKRAFEFLITGAMIAVAMVGATGIASGSETINYSYDAKGRLVRVQHSGTVNNNVVANYTFDAADNRKNLKVTGAP